MNQYNHLIIYFCLLLLIMGCGSQQVETLESKKAELKKLKFTLLTVNQQIQALESEIAELDPELKAKSRRVNVNVLQLEPKDFSHYVKVQGKVEANQSIIVSAQATGTIQQILVDEGQYVKKEAVLAKIDASMMESQIEELETQLDLANITFEKQKNLWDQEIGTEMQYLTVKNQKESLEKRIQTLKEQEKYYQITAPISGSIDEIIPKTGETVATGSPTFRIVNLSDLSLKADLSENYIPYVRKGDKVEVSFPLLNKNDLKARVHAVGQTIDLDNRTFEVEIKLPNDPLFKPNLYGELAINDQTATDAITIPLSILQTSEKGPYVFIAEENEEGNWIAKRRNLTTGFNYKGEIWVQEGLKQDDKLITTGFKNLSEGQLLSLSTENEEQGNEKIE